MELPADFLSQGRGSVMDSVQTRQTSWAGKGVLQLPIIPDLLEFKCHALIQTDPSQRNKSLRCDYHRDLGHETDRYRSHKIYGGKADQGGTPQEICQRT